MTTTTTRPTTGSPGSTTGSWTRCSPARLALGVSRRSSRCCCSPDGHGRHRLVKVKMLPFDNKSEFQVILNMPEGTTLEQTTGWPRRWPPPSARARGARLPDLRRHRLAVQFQRPGAPLLPAPRPQCGRHPGQPAAKGERSAQSHDIAKRCARTRAIAAKYGARGRGRGAARPAGAADPRRRDLRPDRGGSAAEAGQGREIFAATPASSTSTGTSRSAAKVLTVDKEKAALHGITEGTSPGPRAWPCRAIRSTSPPAQRARGCQHRPRTAALASAPARGPALSPCARSAIPRPRWCRCANWSRIERAPASAASTARTSSPSPTSPADVAGAAESPVYAILEMNRGSPNSTEPTLAVRTDR
jgi:hypothetical protein